MGGLPRVGCLAEVRAIRQLPEGRLEVEYAGSRRARLILLHQEQPFKVGGAHVSSGRWASTARPAGFAPASWQDWLGKVLGSCGAFCERCKGKQHGPPVVPDGSAWPGPCHCTVCSRWACLHQRPTQARGPGKQAMHAHKSCPTHLRRTELQRPWVGRNTCAAPA